MNESMYNFMKVGLIAVMAYPSIQKGYGPVEEVIKKIATDEYFNAIGVAWIKDSSVRIKVKKMLDAGYEPYDCSLWGAPKINYCRS